MSDEVKLCELCRMHKKLPLGPAGALWLEKDGAGDAVLMVEPVVGRTLPVAVPVWFCPACGRDFRPRKEETAEGLLPVSAENMEYLKSKAREMLTQRLCCGSAASTVRGLTFRTSNTG